MPKSPVAIASLFHVPGRFVRSVQLERDFADPAALDDYIATPAIAQAFARITEGLRPASGRRAWRITGDYGVGKSSFALVVAQMLARRNDENVARIGRGLGWDAAGDNVPRFWSILLTGSRGPIVPNLARAISDAVEARRPARGKVPRAHSAIMTEAAAVAQSGDAGALEALVASFRALAAEQGEGVLLVIDELGKFLEHVAQNDGNQDVFILQRLAEAASRSGKQPFVLVTMLHQGFHAYAEKLPMASRNEWEKVAGRFEEIVFDQPLAHMAALVAGALRVETAKLPAPLRSAASGIASATADMGWLAGGTVSAADLDITRLYPLHPTILPVLVRFFARFGQHERSLFGFLLSNEPFGLQSFSAQSVAADCWYRLDDLYDYVRACFGHRLAGASYRSHWLRIVETIDSVVDASALELRLLKAIALLNLIDAEDLLPTDRALAAAFSPACEAEVGKALSSLQAQGAIFRRGIAGGYRLWPNASVNLEVALETAARSVGEIRSVAGALIPHLSTDPIMARRHYLETGTLRYFEIGFCAAEDLGEALCREHKADGLLFVALADDQAGADQAATVAYSKAAAERSDIVLCIPPPVAGLAGELRDLSLWTWVAQNTPELAEDTFAAAEVARQVAAARRALLTRAEQLIGMRHASLGSQCIWKGADVPGASRRRGMSSALSAICDELFGKAPRITNELLNRNALSTPAAAARMRLIERLYQSAEAPDLGMDPDKAPPEKSIYLSVLKAGGIHVATDEGFGVTLPSSDDPLQLAPALEELRTRIEAGQGDRVGVVDLFQHLRRPPYGVRDGVAPLLLAILLRTNAHELAVYEHGTFLHRFGPSDFQRLIKGPHYFEIQHCRVSGVRLEVFDALVSTFAKEVQGKSVDLLDVVRPLCQFAAQLPPYSQKSTGLSPAALGVRDALLTAREPITLLFRDLPVACGFAAFEEGLGGDTVRAFASRLQDAIDELRQTYDALLQRIMDRIAAALDQTEGFDRVTLASRASRVSLVAREPRLRTFALRLRDPGLSDTAWAEALASYVVAKPPSKWLAADEARFAEEAGTLAEHFRKTEAAAFAHADMAPQADAVRVNLTRGDGEDLVCIVEPGEDEDLRQQAELLSGRLPKDAQLRRRLLADLMWRELQAEAGEAKVSKPTGATRRGAA
ncbi:hypothetical protein Swit_5328 (plasmid) [Rhizorhabdus wittichii RW1]|jgi:hypothetical protein|uniref:ATP-binding protein n=1 Tax=Rhizorhabdus wittichii (strain DSM 6014 / CCUG 31198 / JCM 15750 / NBRC 105917 / EY 4224 / RW1) TaxID=392499 RepID=A0A9J9LH78_RHIWR|nr:hypothetical protein Swit_5328 [Rhizorhabdus wittichii RW1]